MLYHPKQELLWDTWIVPKDRLFYLFYIRVSAGGARWDGVSLAVSEDLLHWQERGTVLKKHPDALWLGTGMVQDLGGRYVMNFSEERPAGRQVICFAESRDLVNWTRLEGEFAPDGRHYLSDRAQVCDAACRWDSIGVVDALTPHAPPYYGFLTASAPGGRAGKTGALGVARSLDGVTWQCLPRGNATDAFPAYEVPEHVAFGGRHYVIFSASGYLFGRYGRARYLEGGSYYLVSDQLLTGYAEPPGDPMLIGTRDHPSPCMKTVARVVQTGGETLLYYQWGDLRGDGWVGPPLLLEEAAPWRLRLRYWPGTERLKGRALRPAGAFEPARRAFAGAALCVKWSAADNRVAFADNGCADALFRRYEGADERSCYADGRIVECVVRVRRGIGCGFAFACGAQRAAACLNFRDRALEFGPVRDGFAANLNLLAQARSNQPLGYGIVHRVRLLLRGCFVEIYLDGLYADGFRFDAPLDPARIGFYAEQADGAIEEIRVWQMA